VLVTCSTCRHGNQSLDSENGLHRGVKMNISLASLTGSERVDSVGGVTKRRLGDWH